MEDPKRSMAPTYSLRPRGGAPRYTDQARAMADDVLSAGAALRPVVDAYGTFVAASGREAQRTGPEYLLEALTLGVLWRARGGDATRGLGASWAFVERLAALRRAGAPRPRDGSASLILSIDAPFEPGHASPGLEDLDRLLGWLLASGEYDDEVARLDGWRAFLAARGRDAAAILADLVAFAADFEAAAERSLGEFTQGVPAFLRDALPRRRWREDTVQCARRRVEYHLSMVGAELLNRCWRDDFLRCARHVVVLPGCMRRRNDAACRAGRNGLDLRCAGCEVACGVRRATGVARRVGADAVAVVHGSDFSRFLRSPALRGGDVGIVGVACVPGLLGAGWRARAAGLPAQCVLLEASGCDHWRSAAIPTTIDFGILAAILGADRRAAPADAVHADAA